MYQFVVQKSEAGRKLSSVLSTTHHMSRRLLRRLIQDDGVRVNGQLMLMSYILREGDRVQIQFPPEETSVLPESMQIDVVYEDTNVLVVNKRAGVLTHPSARERTGSLLAGVAYYLSSEGLVPHSVHRLDKFTSGAILYAKHAHAHHLLDRALREGLVHRSYVALVHTPRQDLQMGQWFTLTDYIAGDPNKPSRRIIGTQENGQVAITHVCPLAKAGQVYLCVFSLETGRTHQIRLQMAAHGMPLLGDRDYTYAYAGEAPDKFASYYERVLPHQALHAYRLRWQVDKHSEIHEAYAKPRSDLEDIWSMLGGTMTMSELLCKIPT